MRSVDVTELKNRLSHYLGDVRRGEEVLIKDRQQPIAKIVPLTEINNYEEEEKQLFAEGILRAPKKKKLPESFWREKLPKVSLERAVKSVTDERN